MKRLLIKLILPFLLLLSTAQAEEIQLIGDPQFWLGFEINATPTGKKVVERVVRTSAAEPIWAISQWSSRYSLAEDEPVQTAHCWELRDASKFVRFATPGDEADLVLAIDTRKEYLGGPRKKGEPWPHLLVEQSFNEKPRLDTLKALRFTLDARLTRMERFEPEGYTPALHAAQCLLYFVVQNRNRDSAGFGDFLWLGVQIYDDRARSEMKIIEGDVGLGKLIYHPARSDYTDASYTPGEWWHFEADLLPIAKDALRAAWERGFVTDSHDFADFAINGMNLGWEVPGVHDVEVELKGLGLVAEGD